MLFPKQSGVLINLFNGWSSSSTTWRCTPSSGHSTHVRHSSCSTSILVQLGDDRVAHGLDFLLLVVELVHLGKLVSIEPFDSLITLVRNFLHIILRNLIFNLFII